MTRQESAEALLDFVLSRSAHAIGCESANIVLPDGDGWVLRYGYRLPPTLIGQRLSAAETPVDSAVRRTREVIVRNDVRGAPPFSPLGNQWSVLSLAAVPLLAGGELLGVANYAYHSRPAPFQPSEVEFLKRLASLVSLALENIQLREAEAKQAARLTHRVEELQALLDLLPMGVAISSDPLCLDIRANRAFSEMLGIPPGTNSSLSAEGSERLSFTVVRDGRELAPEELPMQIAAARGEETHNLVIEIARADGKPLHLLAHAVPLFDESGATRGALGAFADVTEQRRAQAEADRAQKTLEALLENIPEGITIVDGEGRVLYVSRYEREAAGFGYMGENLGAVADRVHAFEPDGATRVAADDLPLMAALRRGQTVRERELLVLAPDGTWHPVSCSAAPIRDGDGGITGAIQTWRDTVELQRRRRDEAVYRAIAEHYPSGAVVVYDRDLRFVVVGGEAVSSLGLAPQEMIGKTMAEVLDADTAALISPRYLAALEGRASRQDMLYDGHNFAVEYRPIFDADRRVVAAMGASRDITERVQMEAQLRYANEELAAQAEELTASEECIREAAATLEQRVHERTAELLAAQTSLRLQNERLEILHDIERDILAAVEPGEVALTAIERLQQLTGAVRSSVSLFDDATQTGAVVAAVGVPLPGAGIGDRIPYGEIQIGPLKAGQVALTEDLATAPADMPMRGARLAAGIRAVTHVPMAVENNIIGVLALNLPAPGRLSDDLMAVVTHVADSLAIALTNARLHAEVAAQRAELEGLSRRLVEVQEDERAYVADQLFNQAGQVLAALRFQLAAAGKDPSGRRFVDMSAEAVATVDQAMLELHNLASQLRPVGLDRSTLAGVLRQAFRQFAESHGVTATFDADGVEDLRLPVEVVTAVYRVVEEALANIPPDGQVSKAELKLYRTDGQLSIALRHDGAGMDETPGGALTYVSMRQRIQAVGGALLANSGPSGAWLRIRLPVRS